MHVLETMIQSNGFDSLWDRRTLPLAYEQLVDHVDHEPLHSTQELIQWLDEMKARNHIYQKRVDLRMLADWKMNDKGFLVQKQKKFFSIVGIRVRSSSREVPAWSQPILDNAGTGIIGLLCRRVRNRMYFLMQAKAEVGNRTTVQIGPTVQFTQENYTDNDMLPKPFLFDEFSKPQKLIVIGESRQSEEGARFYMEQHIHRILLLPYDVALTLPPEYRWFSYDQIRFFLQLGEQVNSCARSILSCLLSHTEELL